MRRPTDDPIARTIAENKVGSLLTDQSGTAENDTGAARAILGEFDAVEFERTTTKVGGSEIKLRRLVITGPWEVEPQA